MTGSRFAAQPYFAAQSRCRSNHRPARIRAVAVASGQTAWRGGLHRLALAALLGAGLLLAGLSSLRAQVFDPETFTLDNGLEVVVIEHHMAPVVTHMVWYKVGAADEPRGKSGIAHFLEHLMFKGTETAEPGEFSDVIAAFGGRENAFTSQDYTAYFQTVAVERLETMMRYEADRMANLRLTDELVDPERQVVLEERRSRVDNDPSSRLAEMANAAFYLNHPYRLPTIGWEQEIRDLSLQDALDFYEAWYAPDNAILIVAGDVEAEEVRRLAEETYGQIPARGIAERERLREPAHTAPRRVELESAQARQPQVSIRYLAPSYRTAEGEEAYALQVLSEILGGGRVSRLYRSLVVEQGLATSASAWYRPDSYDETSFGFFAAARPDVEIAEVEAALRAEIEALLDEGVSEEEVERAKLRLKADAVYARDSLETAPRVFGVALTTGQSLADVEAWPERIAAVEAEAVSEAARAILRSDFSLTAVLKQPPTS